MPDQNTILLEIHRSVGSLEAEVKGMRGEISEVKGDVGEMRNQVSDLQQGQARVETKLLGFPCAIQADQIKSLEVKIGAVDNKVDDIRSKELPAIHQQLIALDWWKSHKNKAFVAVAATLLGVAGAIAGSLLKDVISPTMGSESRAQAASPPQPVLHLPVETPTKVPQESPDKALLIEGH